MNAIMTIEEMPPQPIHQALDTTKQQFRLMRLASQGSSKLIACSLETFDFEDTPLYKALSYVWGPAEDPQTIQLNGQEFEIRKNLFDFLQVLNERKDEDLIWIDQLCIDQASVSERNSQVGIMGQIYSGATETFIWLGKDPDNGLALTMDIPCEKCATGGHCINYFAKKPLLPAEHAFLSILYNSYWSRHWVAQELTLSENLTILYGKGVYSWHAFRCAQGYVSGHKGYTPTPASHLFNIKYNTKDRFFEIFSKFVKDSQCQDPRDKIYGIQGCLAPERRIKVDYTLSTLQIFLRAVETWYKSETESLVDFFQTCSSFAEGMGLHISEYQPNPSPDADPFWFMARKLESYFRARGRPVRVDARVERLVGPEIVDFVLRHILSARYINDPKYGIVLQKEVHHGLPDCDADGAEKLSSDTELSGHA